MKLAEEILIQASSFHSTTTERLLGNSWLFAMTFLGVPEKARKILILRKLSKNCGNYFCFHHLAETVEKFRKLFCRKLSLRNIGKMLQRVTNEMEREFSDANAEVEFTVCPVPLVDRERALRAGLPADEERSLAKNNSFTYKCGGKYKRCDGSSRRLEVSAASVCEIAKKAAYGAEIAATAFKNAETEFTALKEDALKCDDMRMGQTVVMLTKKAVGEGRKERDAAQSAAKIAMQMCDLASPTSLASDLVGYMANARPASIDAMDAAEKARSWLFAIMSGFGPEVCGEVEIPDSGITTQALYDLTNQATYGAEMTSMAIDLTEAAFMDLKKRAIDCNDLRMAEETVTWAKETMNECREAKRKARDDAEQAKMQLDRSTKFGNISESVDKVHSKCKKSIHRSNGRR